MSRRRRRAARSCWSSTRAASGSANKADVLLQVRPGTDGALALGLIHLLIRERRYDAGFVREWTNAPLLVRDDTGNAAHRPPTSHGDASAGGGRVRSRRRRGAGALVRLRRGARRLRRPTWRSGARRPPASVRLADGHTVTCRPGLRAAGRKRRRVRSRRSSSSITGVPAERIVGGGAAARREPARSHYFHNGLVQHTNATQACAGHRDPLRAARRFRPARRQRARDRRRAWTT